MLRSKKIIYIFIIMFSFMKSAEAKYEKIFFDFQINDINDVQLNLLDYKDKGLIVIGIPSNQFGGQEPGSNDEIKDFCETNFNITFPITSKYDVKGNNAHPIYIWAKNNHGNSAIPKWNFHKILINKEGKIVDTFSSFVKPTSKSLVKKIEEIL